MSLETPLLYLGLMAFTLIIPLVFSFDSKVAYYKSYPALALAIALPMLLFIPWDIAFTEIGIWGFNPLYLSGYEAFGLPLGEWLFFIIVPYSCVFIYRSMDRHFARPWFSDQQASQFAQYFMWMSIAVAIFSWGKWYTVSAFGVLGIVFALHVYVLRVTWLAAFFRAFIIILIPFFIVNGILTGTALNEEVVWYNDAHNLGYRIGTVPVEDVFYGMALLLMNVTFYEYFRARFAKAEKA